MWSLIISFILGFVFCKYLPDLRHRAFARFLVWFSSNVDPAFEAYKKQIFGKIKDEKSRKPGYNALQILEIGVGTGTNFQFFPEGCHLVVVDPNPHFEKYYNENKAKFPHIKSQEFIVAFGEDMSMVPDESVDIVVISLVLCSVKDTQKVLKQVQRVLRPGGKLYYLEHVREFDDAHGTKRFFQDVLSKLNIWPALFDGCDLNRETLKELQAAGFSEVDGKHMRAPINHPLFQLINSQLLGTATK